MRLKLAASLAISLSLTVNLSAHRLDEYLQATLISLEKGGVQVSMRLIPGVAVSPVVLAGIDADSNGVISKSEAEAYAQQVLRDISLTLDGRRVQPQLISVEFPANADIKEGLGEIQVSFTADLPASGPNRVLVFENHHQRRLSVYLANCLVPRDRDIRILNQNRDVTQSFYRIEYTQAGANSSQIPRRSPPLVIANFQLWFHGFANMFELGMRHIAEGTDHLLFVLTLLLPAPLIAAASRWGSPCGVRQCMRKSLQVVTAFTVGHSLTLALAACGVVHAPSGPVEILVAVSILISALHALRPLLPGREAVIAAFFGLIHGLAFASTLGQLGLDRWQRIVSLLGFNLGIETMQLIVVGATVPSLMFLARTRAYSVLRVSGALFAIFASVGWILERGFQLPNYLGPFVNIIAHHAVCLTAALFGISLVVALRQSGFISRFPAGNRKPHPKNSAAWLGIHLNISTMISHDPAGDIQP